MPRLVLALDQGTTGSTAAFFDADTLTLVANTKVEFPQIYPKPGWVEHSPDAIWNSVVKAIQGASEFLKERGSYQMTDLIAVGITNQRETIIAWDRLTGETAGNAIVWQDRRTAKFCDTLKRNTKLRKEVLKKTGLVCDPYFSGSKIKWMNENYSKCKAFAKRGTLLTGTVDSYLIYKLTGGKSAVTDDTNASRTMLYNLRSGTYDKELLQLFGVKESFLPEIRPSAGLFGVTLSVPGIPNGIPITGCLGDQQAALFGHDALKKGEGKITYGTGAFLLMNTGKDLSTSDNGMLTTVAYSEKGSRAFAFEGSAFIAGAAIQFLRDNFHWFKSAPESDALAVSVPRDPNLTFIPALAGLGAPFWNPEAKGVLFGLTRGTKKAQIIRAVLESIALQNVQILKLMESSLKQRIRRLGVDGGAAKSDFLMQFQADTVRVVLQRLQTTEITALGGAKIALRGLGEFPKNINLTEKTFKPKISPKEANLIVSAWNKAASAVDVFYKS